MYHKYFFQACGLSFQFLTVSYKKNNFVEHKLSCFLLCFMLLGFQFKKSIPKLWKCFVLVSSRIFTVSDFTVSCMIRFKLISVFVKRQKPVFSFFFKLISMLFHTHLFKRLSFPHLGTCVIHKLSIHEWVYLWTIYLYALSLYRYQKVLITVALGKFWNHALQVLQICSAFSKLFDHPRSFAFPRTL